MRIVRTFSYLISALIGVAFAVMAVIFIASVSANNLSLLRAAGVVLFGVVAAHLFPLGTVSKQPQIALYVALSVAAAWAFGVLYYFAEIDDPFRNEGKLFSNVPFRLAFFLSIMPVLRAALRILLLRSTAKSSE